MSLVKTWFTVEEAEAKFGVDRERILQMVEDGVVRAEQEAGQPLRVDGEDIALQIGEVAGP